MSKEKLIDRYSRSVADVAWHETELQHLRQQIDVDRAWLSAQSLALVPLSQNPQSQRRVRQWCRVQRLRLTQQRREREGK